MFEKDEVKSKYETEKSFTGEVIGVRTVQDYGRIQIPKIVRNKLELKDGDRVYWVCSSNKFYIVKAIEVK